MFSLLIPDQGKCDHHHLASSLLQSDLPIFVGCSSLVMMPILSSSALTLSLNMYGIPLGGWTTGVTLYLIFTRESTNPTELTSVSLEFFRLGISITLTPNGKQSLSQLSQIKVEIPPCKIQNADLSNSSVSPSSERIEELRSVVVYMRVQRSFAFGRNMVTEINELISGMIGVY